MKIFFEKMDKLSFPDGEVSLFNLDTQKKELTIVVKSAWFEEGSGKEMEEGELFFHHWEKVEIKTFDHEKEEWMQTSSDKDVLKDICESNFSVKEVTLKGFGKHHGNWMEFKLLSPSGYASF